MDDPLSFYRLVAETAGSSGPGLLNSSGFVALVSAGATIAVAYIVNVLAKKRKDSKPVDRMSTIFDGYEKLIAQQQEEIVRKGSTITALEAATARLEKQLDETKELLHAAREELTESRDHATNLRSELAAMRAEYKKVKHGS